MLGSAAEADEAVQETMVRAWKSLEKKAVEIGAPAKPLKDYGFTYGWSVQKA